MREYDVIVVMGVSGSGKSTIGRRLARRLGVDFGDADVLHSRDSVAKLSAGIPLTDADRWPWLHDVGRWIDDHRVAVVACSALKRKYRDLLTGDRRGVSFVYLHEDRELLERRLARRAGHFMPARLLDSQLADLEPPGEDEAALTVPVTADDSPRSIVDEIIARLPGAGPRH